VKEFDSKKTVLARANTVYKVFSTQEYTTLAHSVAAQVSITVV